MNNSIAPSSYFHKDGVSIRAGGSISIIGTDQCSLEDYAGSLKGDWEVSEDDKCIYLKASLWGPESSWHIPDKMPISRLETRIDENGDLEVKIAAKANGAFGFSKASHETTVTMPLPPGIDRMHEPKRSIWAKEGIVQLAFYKR